jgi:hypothetical protein
MRLVKQTTKDIIKQTFATQCSMRIINYKCKRVLEIDTIKVRVHFNDMRFCKYEDEQILELLQEKLPLVYSLTYNEEDSTGNQYIIIINSDPKSK